jgi:hypothetical protein
VEGLDFGETYAPVAHLEAMRIHLACRKKSMLGNPRFREPQVS